MKSFDIRVTDTNDASDFVTMTHFTEEDTAGDIADMFNRAMTCAGTIQFQDGNRYIVIEEASDEGFMYYIWNSKEDYENDDILDSEDGGQCTGTLSDALGMALN